MKRETDDQRGERLMKSALDLVVRVRDDAPAANVRWLKSMPAGDVLHMAILLAALVPDDRSRDELLAWWQEEREANVHALTAERFRLVGGSA